MQPSKDGTLEKLSPFCSLLPILMNFPSNALAIVVTFQDQPTRWPSLLHFIRFVLPCLCITASTYLIKPFSLPVPFLFGKWPLFKIKLPHVGQKKCVAWGFDNVCGRSADTYEERFSVCRFYFIYVVRRFDIWTEHMCTRRTLIRHIYINIPELREWNYIFQAV